MNPITAIPNAQKNGFHFPSEYNRALLLEWFKKYKRFKIIPDFEDTIPGRRYLEGAIIPAYCEWQYGINAREKGKDEQRRFLFKRDFNYEIVENRDGNPVRAVLSSKGLASKINDTYTKWASENGAPIPNPKLFKLWRDKWKNDLRFPSFFEFLDFLELECDAMPSSETLAKLEVEEKEIAYPENKLGKVPF